jgi:hypothetical protein
MHLGSPLFWPVIIILIMMLIPKISLGIVFLLISPFLM